MPGRLPEGYTKRGNVYGRIDYVSKRNENETFNQAAFNTASMVAQAVAGAGSSVLVSIGAFARAFESLQNPSNVYAKTQLINVHQQVGLAAQKATVAAYDDAKQASPRADVEPYRQGAGPGHTNARYAGGVMREALENPLLFRATYDGIGFINEAYLNKVAWQWHRLNFGAGGASGWQNTEHPVVWGGLVLTSLGLPAEHPSADFDLPGGHFTPGGQFYPFKTGGWSNQDKSWQFVKPTPTKGIAAWNFFDAGIRVMAQELGPRYEGLAQNWMAGARRGSGPLKRDLFFKNLPRSGTPYRP